MPPATVAELRHLWRTRFRTNFLWRPFGTLLMGKKRRSDKYHDIGDPKPGTVGDKRPSRDPGNTPMQRIHNRRHGELSVPEPSNNHNHSNQNDQEEEEEDERDPYYQNKEHLAELPEEALRAMEKY